jgi:hypothetical protein
MDLSKPLSENVGLHLAQWAKGENKPEPQAAGTVGDHLADSTRQPATPQASDGPAPAPITDAAWKKWLLYVEADDERGNVLADFKEREEIESLASIKPVNRAKFMFALSEYAETRGVEIKVTT